MKCVVVAPTYNNAATLLGVLNAVGAAGADVIVVNDGSDDETASLLNAWRDANAGRHVVEHAANRGKAAALQSGFDLARRLGFTHAATIDTDGQHDPNDLPALKSLAEAEPDAIIVGVRSLDVANYPAKSRIGRGVSNLLVRALGGIRVSDSQCGLRVYPLAVLDLLHARAGRYAFETEVLIRAGWANVRVVQVPIRCIYFDGTARVTHFKPWRDSLSATWMHMKLIARSLWPVPKPKLHASTPATTTGTLIERSLRWMNPLPTIRAARRSTRARETVARSMGVGAFFALLPPLGFKTIACLAISKSMRLQPTIVLAVSSLQTPPVGFLFAFVALHVGHLLLAGSFMRAGEFDLSAGSMPRLIGFALACWCVGGVVSGALIGLLTYAVVRGRGTDEENASTAAMSAASFRQDTR